MDVSESKNYWMQVFDEIKSRGVEDVFFISMDGVVSDNIHYLRNKGNVSYASDKEELSKYRDNYDYVCYCEKMNKILENPSGITRNKLDHIIWLIFREPVANNK